MLKIRTIIFSALAILQIPTFAQEEEQDASKLEGLTVTFGFLTPGLLIAADLPKAGTETLNFKPATQGKTFLGFDYNNYGLSISTFNPKEEQFKEKFGNGNAQDYQFRFLYEEIYFEAIYQRYRGYYLEDPRAVSSSPFGPNGEYPQYSGLKTEHYGFQFIKFRNLERFSPKRAFDFTEAPKGSGGSWFYSGSLNKHRITTPISLVPAMPLDNYGKLADLRAAEATTLALGGGGAYSYVYRDHWVLSGLLGFSLGSQLSRAKYLSDDEESSRVASKLIARIGLGYSGKKFIAGLQAATDTTIISNSSSRFDLMSSQVVLFGGWRF